MINLYNDNNELCDNGSNLDGWQFSIKGEEAGFDCTNAFNQIIHCLVVMVMDYVTKDKGNEE